MARLPIISAAQQDADAVSIVEPLTIQSNQGRDFMSGYQGQFDAAHGAGRGARNARINAGNPVADMRRGYQMSYADQASQQIMTTMLSGIRRSGSMARSIRTRGLGAVDCASIAEGTWSGAQAEAFMAFTLAASGLPEFTALSNSIPAMGCYAVWLSKHIVSDTAILAQAQSIAIALKAQGAFGGIAADNPNLLAALGAMVHAHGLTPKRAVQLYSCGMGITKNGGWADYATSWAETSCMQSWYENPWYLGAGAAVLIGAVWFATKKKRS